MLPSCKSVTSDEYITGRRSGIKGMSPSSSSGDHHDMSSEEKTLRHARQLLWNELHGFRIRAGSFASEWPIGIGGYLFYTHSG